MSRVREQVKKIKGQGVPCLSISDQDRDVCYPLSGVKGYILLLSIYLSIYLKYSLLSLWHHRGLTDHTSNRKCF